MASNETHPARTDPERPHRVVHALVLGVVLGGLLLHPPAVLAQRPDPARPVQVDKEALESARAALGSGVDPSAVARDLARTHLQGPEQAMAILLRSGLAPESVARTVMQETRAPGADILVWMIHELAQRGAATRTGSASEAAVTETVPAMLIAGVSPVSLADAVLGMYVTDQLPGMDPAALAAAFLALGLSPEAAAARLYALEAATAVAAALVHAMVHEDSPGQAPTSAVVVHRTVAALLAPGYAPWDVAAELRDLALPADEILQGILDTDADLTSAPGLLQVATDVLGLTGHEVLERVARYLGPDVSAEELGSLIHWATTTVGMGPGGMWAVLKTEISLTVPLVVEALSGWTHVQVLGTLLDGGFDLMASVKAAADQLGMGALETAQVLISKGVSAQQAGEALQSAFDLTVFEAGQILTQVFGGA